MNGKVILMYGYDNTDRLYRCTLEALGRKTECIITKLSVVSFEQAKKECVEEFKWIPSPLPETEVVEVI